MRYFLNLAYNGTRFCGWQRQPNIPSPKGVLRTVQATIEDTFTLILRQPIEIVGCGRTDSGVHASQYFAHFDFDGEFPPTFLDRANKLVGKDILLKKIIPVLSDAHARFDAYLRSYEYHLTVIKNPFKHETSWHFTYHKVLNINEMQKAAEILRGYSEFAPFCKTHSDTPTMKCDINRSEWIFTGDKAVFHISANRFLRGMVRLIVGACINIGLEQMTLDDLKKALDEQAPLKKSYSVPPTGLFLTAVKYPYEV